MIHCIVCNEEADYTVLGNSFCVEHAGVSYEIQKQLKEIKLDELKEKLASK